MYNSWILILEEFLKMLDEDRDREAHNFNGDKDNESDYVFTMSHHMSPNIFYILDYIAVFWSGRRYVL